MLNIEKSNKQLSKNFGIGFDFQVMKPKTMVLCILYLVFQLLYFVSSLIDQEYFVQHIVDIQSVIKFQLDSQEFLVKMKCLKFKENFKKLTEDTSNGKTNIVSNEKYQEINTESVTIGC